mgnify:CR=1 FL=1
MTLQEARHVLESAKPRDAVLRQAIRVALTALPDDPETYRPAVVRRYEDMLERLAAAMDGFNPFKERTRLRNVTVWRYAIYHQLRLEGYSCTQIGRATGYDHSTVWWGDARITDWLDVRDYDTVKVWRDFLKIVVNN